MSLKVRHWRNDHPSGEGTVCGMMDRDQICYPDPVKLLNALEMHTTITSDHPAVVQEVQRNWKCYEDDEFWKSEHEWSTCETGVTAIYPNPNQSVSTITATNDSVHKMLHRRLKLHVCKLQLLRALQLESHRWGLRFTHKRGVFGWNVLSRVRHDTPTQCTVRPKHQLGNSARQSKGKRVVWSASWPCGGTIFLCRGVNYCDCLPGHVGTVCIPPDRTPAT